MEFQGRDNGVDVTRSSGLPSSSGAAIDIKHSNTKQPFKSIYPRLDDVSKPITEQPRESKSGKTMPARHARTPSAKKCGSSSTIEDCLEQFIRPEVIRGENSLCQACDLKARRMGRYCTGCCLGTNFARGKFTLLFFAPSLALPRCNLLFESTLPCVCSMDCDVLLMVGGMGWFYEHYVLQSIVTIVNVLQVRCVQKKVLLCTILYSLYSCANLRWDIEESLYIES